MPITSSEHPDVEKFLALVESVTDLADYPNASHVADLAVVYDSEHVRRIVGSEGPQVLMAEFAKALLDGPGLVVFEGALADSEVVDRVSSEFFAMIAEQHARGAVIGDHYAKPGANDRVWNALEKLAVANPAAFVDYYENDIIALISRAWLGPGYQITSQVNVVNPGGQAQEPHCDYHLGFMSQDVASQFPAHAHRVSPALTLQGAVAHCDMPLESGPTLYLPYSQRFDWPYLSWRLPEFREVFRDHVVQLPLRKGDAAFFNPSLFHAAGTNFSTDIKRMANLLQVSSAMGRSLEAVDRARMTRAVYPTLLERSLPGASGALSDASMANVIAATAEWYPFPTNLDRDPPVGGLVPPSQAEVLRQALSERWTVEMLDQALSQHSERHLSW